MLLFINLNTNVMLATPTQKQNVTWFSQQFLNNFTTKKSENFGKMWVVNARYLWFNFSNCFYSVTLISTFNTASCVFFLLVFLCVCVITQGGDWELHRFLKMESYQKKLLKSTFLAFFGDIYNEILNKTVIAQHFAPMLWN